MRERALGGSGLCVSAVGFDVGALVTGPAPRGDEDVTALLHRALDLGVTLFDTAGTDADAEGRDERLLGRAVRGGTRERVVLAAKFGYEQQSSWDRPGERWWRQDWTVEAAGRALDRTLSRLRTEPVDLWQLHHPPMAALEDGALFDFLDEQVAKGKIRAYGVALGPPGDPGAERPGWGDEGAAALRERHVPAVRGVFGLWHPDPGRELGRLAAGEGAGLLARIPPRPAADPYHLDFLTRDRGRTLTQAALGWVLAQPGVAAVLPRTGDADRLAEAALAADLPALTAEDLDLVAEQHETTRGPRR